MCPAGLHRSRRLCLVSALAIIIIPLLAVEVVGREESRMLALYRALAPLAQRRLRTHVWHLYARACGALPPAGLISRRAREPDGAP